MSITYAISIFLSLVGCSLLILSGSYFILAIVLEIQKHSLTRREYLEKWVERGYAMRASHRAFIGWFLLGIFSFLDHEYTLLGKSFVWGLIFLISWILLKRSWKKKVRELGKMKLIPD